MRHTIHMSFATPSPTIESVATPAVVINAARVRRNIERLSAYAHAHGIDVRPHAKTHKSVEIARLQRAAGACGLTVAKVGEAETLLPSFEAREPDILVAYPVVDPVRVALDSLFALEAVGAVARLAGTTIGVLVDLDVGMGRTGMPTADALVTLAQAVAAAPGLRLDGIFCYPGHIWAKPAE
jgi:D-serine deaminase-like pyridoxal phosphate-dependent protein